MTVRSSLLQCIFPRLFHAPTQNKHAPEEETHHQGYEDERSYETYRFHSVWEGEETTILTVFRWSSGDSGVSVKHNGTELHFDLEAWCHGFLIPSLRHFRKETCGRVHTDEGIARVEELIARYSNCKWDTSSAEDINGFIEDASWMINGEDFWLNRMRHMARPLISAWIELRDNGKSGVRPITEMMDLDSYIEISQDTNVSAQVREKLVDYLRIQGFCSSDGGDDGPSVSDVDLNGVRMRHGLITILLNQLVAPSNGREGAKRINNRYRQDDVCLGYRSKQPICAVSVVAEGGVYKIELTHPSKEFKSVSMSVRD